MSFILSLTLAGSLLGNQFTNNDSLNAIRLKKIELSFGQETSFYLNPRLDDFLKMHPQSMILKEFDPDNSQASYSTSSFAASLETYFSLSGSRATRRINPFLRLGVNYLSLSNLSISDFRETPLSSDTLISASSGNTIYVDTIMRHYRSASLSSRKVRANVALLFNFNQSKRLSFTTGIGMLVGASISSQTEVLNYSNKSVDVYNDNNQFVYSGYYENTNPNPMNFTETFTSPSIFHFQLYAPFILNYQLGKRTLDGFNSKYELQLEVSPGMAFERIKKTTGFSFSTIQSRISLIREL